jgi:hypothetical protein
MLVLSGGQERINAGYCELLTVAGSSPATSSRSRFPYG